MAELSRIFRWTWIPAALLACAFLARIDAWRIERVEGDTRLFATDEVVDSTSPTGLPLAQRDLIVPERNEDSFHWIMQTQEMMARHAWRLRHVDYENAPEGRAVSTTSPYRWWLGLLAQIDHTVSGRPIGLAVTHAALYADPIMQALALLVLTSFVAYAFSGFSATCFALGFATLFPLATLFQPGAPDDRGLAAVAAITELLVVLWALQNKDSLRRRWPWIAAGLVGAVNLWISVQTAVPAMLGIVIGGLVFAFMRRDEQSGSLWRVWSYVGALATVVAWLIEYFPSHCLNWNIEFVHPLYALAWLGLGEILAQLTSEEGKTRLWWRTLLMCLLGVATLIPIAVIMVKVDTRGFLAVDLLAQRLTKLPGSPLASSTQAWLLRDGFTGTFAVSAFCVLIALSIVLMAWRSRGKGDPSYYVLLGALGLAVGFAWTELTFWSAVGGVALASLTLLPADATKVAGRVRWLGALLILIGAYGGAKRAWPGAESRAGATLTAASAQLLIERDLAHWLTQRTGGDGSVVLASPRVSLSQSFYGNLRGIGTVNTDNRAGLGATIAIISATTMEEAQALMAQRNVAYLIIPSWDPFFEDYTHLYLAKNFAGWHPFFIPQLRQWHLPAWLRPVPFEMPPIGGYEGQTVLIFQIVPDQNPAVAASRLGEYFVESGRTADLGWADDALRRFPGDVGALAARAQIAAARNDDATYQQIVATLGPRLKGNGDRFLPWDRRVSLAIALARGGQQELAHMQIVRCIQEMDLPKARLLSTGFLYNLLLIANSHRVPIDNPTLRSEVLGLLSPDLRSELGH